MRYYSKYIVNLNNIKICLKIKGSLTLNTRIKHLWRQAKSTKAIRKFYFHTKLSGVFLRLWLTYIYMKIKLRIGTTYREQYGIE